MSPPVAEQIISVLNVLLDQSPESEGLLLMKEKKRKVHQNLFLINIGRRRINQLAWNTRYFRQRLTKMGFIVYGHPHSPVVPALLYSPSKIAYIEKHKISIIFLLKFVGLF